MTNKNITAILFRFSGLFLFMKIFEHFGSYFLSIYIFATATEFFGEQQPSTLEKFYLNGTFLFIANVLVSFFLIFKADYLSDKLVKNDNELKINLTQDSLTNSILKTIGIIWLAYAIYRIPDCFNYLSVGINNFSENPHQKLPDFSLAEYILKSAIAVLFVSKSEKIVARLYKKTLHNTK
jgi:hypothetical protein